MQRYSAHSFSLRVPPYKDIILFSSWDLNPHIYSKIPFSVAAQVYLLLLIYPHKTLLSNNKTHQLGGCIRGEFTKRSFTAFTKFKLTLLLEVVALWAVVQGISHASWIGSNIIFPFVLTQGFFELSTKPISCI